MTHGTSNCRGTVKVNRHYNQAAWLTANHIWYIPAIKDLLDQLYAMAGWWRKWPTFMATQRGCLPAKHETSGLKQSIGHRVTNKINTLLYHKICNLAKLQNLLYPGGKSCARALLGKLEKTTLLCTRIYNNGKSNKPINWFVEITALRTS